MDKLGRYNIVIKSILQSPWTFLTVIMRAIGSISVMKIVAVYFGSAGVALFSHFLNLIALVTQIPEQGSNFAIIRLYNEFDKKGKTRLISTSLLINLLTFVIIGGLISINSGFFLEYFPSFQLGSQFFWLLLISIFFVLLNSLALSFLYAKQLYSILFGITIYNVVLLIISAWIGATQQSINQLMIYFSGGWALYSILNFGFLYLRGILPRISFRWDKEMIGNLSHFILIAIAGILLGKWVDYFVRDFAIEWYGAFETGLWQAQMRISDNYRSVFMGTLGLIFYSQISGIINKPAEIGRYTRQMLFIAFIVSAIGLLIIWLLRVPLIQLLFQKELVPAGEFIQYQLLADVFALPAYLLVFVVIAQKRIKAYVRIHLFSAGIYVVAVVLLSGLTEVGVVVIPIANLIRMILFLAVLLLANRKMLGQ